MTRDQKKPLWKVSNAIAKYIYEVLEDFPDDEKWDTVSKLKHAASDLVFHVGLAEGGDLSPSGAQFDWENVRRYAFGLKTVYLFCVDQDYIEIEPEIVVKLDQLIKTAEVKYQQGIQDQENQRKADLAPWQEKYRLWKEMQK